MTKFARATSLSAVELAIRNNPQPHSAPDRNGQEIIHTLTVTKPSFGESQRVDIVLNVNRNSKFALEHRTQRNVIPTINRRLTQYAIFRIHNTCQSNTNTKQLFFGDLLCTDK